LSHRLLGPAADYEAELRTLELLKLRFGEAALADCEIMLRDVADSRRVTKLCAAEGEAPLAALVLSHLYWPALPAALPLTPAPALHALLERFQASFAERKASRRLAWHLGLGEVALEVKLPSGRFLDFEGLSFLQATLLQLLREQPHWTAEGLVARTGLTAAPGGPEAVRRGLQFWAGAGLAREDPLGHWALREDEAWVRADGGTGAAEAMEESEEEGEEDLAVAEPFVLHMLNNLGPLALPQIQDQLRSFAEIDRPLPVLREFLAAMVASEKLLLKDGLYSSIGK
jgi:anaphase-promoting complex subunit 2